ncbi:proline racemase family protein [Marinomonas pollencensis]|uniref:4-hydroxyproline epimerase n=1 Tax=Marinomonas pollencensis TaxID=491954 RepID=A0A3E0DQP7_9GAMM|nr:proline racemase family protein [Marinomonas pollencensis]REG83832.1 4-hydroxyproline epimerase [Marinomonas pollencensis]
MLVIDSHTEGEPTRVIVEGGPDLGSGPLSERAARLGSEFTDFYRSIVAEPYGQEAMVGALLTEPTNPECVAGVIYFDAAAVIGMCGHGTIGLAVTLAHLGKIGPGTHKIETPVGIVDVTLKDKNTVTVTNIDSYRSQKTVTVEVSGIGKVTGDIAYGGNWCFIIDHSPVPVIPSNIMALTEVGVAIREAIYAQGISGEEGGVIDHILFYGSPLNPNNHSRNFVLCPDNAYDRSPCGTGSSARLACLAADGLLQAGKQIYQESIIGSGYTLSYQASPKTHGAVVASITGSAFVTREAKLINNPTDPLRHGVTLTQ